MSNIDISIIIPSKNNKAKTAAIIKRISEEMPDVRIEYIVIDMNSTDGGVLEALEVIKKNDLTGCVIQSGGGNVSSALNTGIYKADGKYITFVYPTRLYKNYLADYYSAAVEKQADLVFAVPQRAEEARSFVPDSITGTDIAVNLIRSKMVIEFTAVMFEREFLLKNNIRFYEECTIGYAEAFIFNSLMYDPIIAYVDKDLERDLVNSLSKDESAGVSNNCFERLDALLRVRETMRHCHRNDIVLLDSFDYQKLPSVIMSCVDRLLNEGFSAGSIKKLLHNKHYDKYLELSSDMPISLKKKIIIWRTLPFAYKPDK